MFAVPGWSVSSAALRAETEPKNPKPEGAAPNKRKRATKKKEESVTEDNVANLWERVIEGKPAKKTERKPKDTPKAASKALPQQLPRPKTDKKNEWAGLSDTEHAVSGHQSDEPPRKRSKKDKKTQPLGRATGGPDGAPVAQPNKKRRSSAADGASQPQVEADSPPAATEVAASKSAGAAPAAPKLTPLQASMRAKLTSARFRHLNETLYTRPSAEALRLFTESPDMFGEYHEGFRRQVEVWPENPVDGYIDDIKSRAKVRPPRDSHKHRNPRQAPESDGPVSLPRTGNTATIADMGCGDARLAETLTPLARKLKLSIHSFDLYSPSPHVTRADIANVPLADGAADVVIFCLALMGTNWLDFIEEAYRILRWKGELWIAEIKSRFAGKGGVASTRVEHSVGNRKRQQTAGKKGKAVSEAEAEADKEELAVAVDGADDKRGETDISAFVEALRRRGFVLQGNDMSNKMFARMLFVKAAPPVKGKGVEAAKAREAAMAQGNKKQKRFEWDTKDPGEEIDESGILKPCVYKIR